MNWSASKASQVLAPLRRIGWSIKRESGGSHRVLQRDAGRITCSPSTIARRSDRECSRA
jgi:predicted RNA binding protein YcfA (HicA-like mRNA interferase family)